MLGTKTRIITAKFDSPRGKPCHCGLPISAGERIAWDPKTKATAHEDCHTRVLAEVEVPKRGVGSRQRYATGNALVSAYGTPAEAARGVGEMGTDWYYEDEADARMDEADGTPGARAVHPEQKILEDELEANGVPAGPEPGTYAYTACLMADLMPDYDWDQWKDEMKERDL